MKIGRDTLLKSLSLAHIYNNVVLIIKLITARFVRHIEYDVLQIGQPFFVFFVCHTCAFPLYKRED